MPTHPFGAIKNAADETLDYTAEDAGDKTAGPLVVIGHGVTANKDRPWALTLAGALNAAGFATVRFSFSGNGESEGDFRDSTVSKEVSDLTAVLDAVEARGPLVYVGHSMGGAVGLIAAAQDARIKALVSLAGMVDCADFNRRKFADLTPGQDVMWGKTECPVSQAFVDDMNQIGTLLPRAIEVRVPWLLVHGTEDTVVPFAESLAIVEAATNAPTELVELGGADHLFSGPDEPVMAQAVVAWLKRLDLSA